MKKVCLDGDENDRMAFQSRADYQNYAIEQLQRGYNALALDCGTIFTNLDGIW